MTNKKIINYTEGIWILFLNYWKILHYDSYCNYHGYCICKSNYKNIYNGRNFKADLVTRKGTSDLKKKCRDMRSYASQIQKSVSEALMLVLNNKLGNIDTAKEAADTKLKLKQKSTFNLKNINEKYDSMKT